MVLHTLCAVCDGLQLLCTSRSSHAYVFTVCMFTSATSLGTLSPPTLLKATAIGHVFETKWWRAEQNVDQDLTLPKIVRFRKVQTFLSIAPLSPILEP